MNNIYEYDYKDKNGNIIHYDINNATFDKKGLKPDEQKSANTLKNKLNWNIEVVHRINKPDGIKTADIRVNGKEYWEIKNRKISDKRKEECEKTNKYPFI